jgi:carotenoid 1,2-hydratase
MTERARSALSRDADTIAVGRSRMVWAGDHLRIDIDERAAPVPFPVRGCVRVIPELLQPVEFALDPKASHVWRPIAPRARIEASFQEPALAWSGIGYFDCNAGLEPLEAGFSGWTWARTHLPAGATAIHYDAHRRDGGRTALALTFDAAGAPVATEFPNVAPMPNGFWGVARAAASETDARLISALEDSPFYTRSEIEITVDGARRRAMHESLDLDRFAQSWVKALLPFRMPRIGFL